MDEINFDKEVAEYYDKVIEKGYHNNKEYFSKLLEIIKKGESVLELGCGTGKVMLELLERGILIEGIDISKPMTERLILRNNKAVVHLSKILDFEPTKKYDYALSCNGPFSVKGDELESYILDKRELFKVLEKCAKMVRKGLLINLGTEKAEIRIPLGDNEVFIHKEEKVKDYTFMLNFILQNDEVKIKKRFTKRRYKIAEILKNAKIKDFDKFKLVRF